MSSIYGNHIESVEMVASAGGQIPAEWTRIREAYETKYEYRQDDFTFRLVEAIVDAESSDTDVSELRAITLADAVSSVQGTQGGNAYGTASGLLDETVRRSIAGKLINVYNKVADANLRVVAKAFDIEWNRFTELAVKVDPEIVSDKLVGRPMDIQTAWLEIAEVSKRLDILLSVLGEAYNLASTVARIVNDDSRLGLVLAPTAVGKERKAVWDAWSATGNRCGRWSALLALGETVKAVAAPKDYKTYGEYIGTVEKHEPVQYGMRAYRVDAETGKRVDG